ncbi:MAG: hypothetical protein AAGC92_10970 [Pseudomonadota bacterium]
MTIDPEAKGDVAARYVAETHRLHVVLEEWLVGATPKTEAAFQPFAAALAPELVVISPSGSQTAHADLLAEFFDIHGALAADRDIFRIWVENASAREVAPGLGLATYEEWHQRGAEVSARLTSVLMREDPRAPGGVVWLHVHETWLPGRAPKAGERFPQ